MDEILAVGALEISKGLVVELTCGVDPCRDHAQAMALLRRVLGRAERLAGEAPPLKETGQARAGSGEARRPSRSTKQKKHEELPESEPPPENKPFQLKPPELHR